MSVEHLLSPKLDASTVQGTLAYIKSRIATSLLSVTIPVSSPLTDWFECKERV